MKTTKQLYANPIRRKTLIALGAAIVAGPSQAQYSLMPRGRPACLLTARQTEGPYYVDTRLNRSDLRKDPTDGSVRPGVPLTLNLRVQSAKTDSCTPLAGATVHIWHCDAAGLYSGVDDQHADTRGKQFLRGYQRTDAKGQVRFQTIFPGWYPGRTVHIHFKVQTRDAEGKPYELTSQLYFDDEVIEKVMAQPPYSGRGKRSHSNFSDGLFRRGGRELLVSLTETGKGYTASFDINLQLA